MNSRRIVRMWVHLINLRVWTSTKSLVFACTILCKNVWSLVRPYKSESQQEAEKYMIVISRENFRELATVCIYYCLELEFVGYTTEIHEKTEKRLQSYYTSSLSFTSKTDPN